MIFSQLDLRPRMHGKSLSVVGCAIFALSLAAVTTQSGGQGLPQSAVPQVDPAHAQIDSDADGLSDDLEQALLVQFAPRFLVGQDDCSNVPAEFQSGSARPQVKSENGTIYGQVFPAKNLIDGAPVAEIHYYLLWRIDCGRHGHPLDAEHVAVLIRASGPDLYSATWKALYWYAAAHENTVCDVSQIARASTLHAEDAGPRISISPGKHASYLNQSLCQRGCGADRCENMVALAPAKLVNLGELAHPMNDSLFTASTDWPLAAKMAKTNFPSSALARLSQIPDSEIAWFNEGRHPSQGVIAISSATEQAIAGSGGDAIDGISSAAAATNGSISVASGSTGNALQKSGRNTIHALGVAFRHIGELLDTKPHPGSANPPAETKPQ